MSKVTKRTQAERDLEESFVFIGERDLDSGFDFLAAAEHTFEFLSKMPLIGSPRAFSPARLSNVRQWPIKGYELYLIFYRPTTTVLKSCEFSTAAETLELSLKMNDRGQGYHSCKHNQRT